LNPSQVAPVSVSVPLYLVSDGYTHTGESSNYVGPGLPNSGLRRMTTTHCIKVGSNDDFGRRHHESMISDGFTCHTRVDEIEVYPYYVSQEQPGTSLRRMTPTMSKMTPIEVGSPHDDVFSRRHHESMISDGFTCHTRVDEIEVYPYYVSQELPGTSLRRMTATMSRTT
jgi:hypothetical protein